MIQLVVYPLSVLLRRRLPQTKEEWNLFFAICVLGAIYILFKEKVLTGIIRWIASGMLFIGAVIGMYISHDRGERFFLWCLTGAFFYCVMFELGRRLTINRRDVYYPPGEEPSKEELKLTGEEELDINKIVLVLVVVWFIAGFFITRKM